MVKYDWNVDGDGYDVSSTGDKRFCPFFAKLKDGRTIQEHFECDVKGFDPGGRQWIKGRTAAAINGRTDLWSPYLMLWTLWAMKNMDLIYDLKAHADANHGVLKSAMSAVNECDHVINSAHALAEILNLLFTYE